MRINNKDVTDAIERMLFIAYGQIKDEGDEDLRRLREVNEKYREFLST